MNNNRLRPFNFLQSLTIWNQFSKQYSDESEQHTSEEVFKADAKDNLSNFILDQSLKETSGPTWLWLANVHLY